jgi:hypothetical protein
MADDLIGPSADTNALTAGVDMDHERLVSHDHDERLVSHDHDLKQWASDAGGSGAPTAAAGGDPAGAASSPSDG